LYDKSDRMSLETTFPHLYLQQMVPSCSSHLQDHTVCRSAAESFDERIHVSGVEWRIGKFQDVIISPKENPLSSETPGP